MLTRPGTSEYAAFYQKYIDRVQEDVDVMELIRTNADTTRNMVKDLPEEKLLFRYERDKWSIKEILMHVADGERVFSYRALRIARGDKTPLPGFEENDYAPASRADARSIGSILDEMAAIRHSTIELFKNLDRDAWTRMGTASNSPISVRALAFIIAGHEMHHQGIIRERYLK